MKYLFLTFLATLTLMANEGKLIIDAKKFEANDAKGISVFTGNVKLKKEKDRLNSDRLDVYMSAKSSTKKRTPLKYVATGKVTFEIISQDKHYEGKGDKVIYYPSKQQYEIYGNGFIKEKIEDRKIYGNIIYINQVTGEAKVSGTDNKPVRFIINIEDKNEKKADK
ncbi:LptA/OstA family protein [Malaciobacter marinus]|jgi:lipopolysaccharide export system protein LptA|uniref:Lipopolysaccharide export system protein LptA n=1 Tax=Malaciobacter marinus TaxID=505249 RepID=A0AB37A167_9BACT|nr:LptA/OstA family protein [Malaciobacter marinus]PPK62979.1 lipopolysaccharide export system protein LptA [Malaciobacter marinus]SKB66983.1 lipopolysaccharide export system protein LptA [Malaciobacter marinus]